MTVTSNLMNELCKLNCCQDRMLHSRIARSAIAEPPHLHIRIDEEAVDTFPIPLKNRGK